MVIVDGEEAEGRIPCTWLLHGNEPLSALLLCRTHLEGVYFDSWSDIGLCIVFVNQLNHCHCFYFVGVGSLDL